MFRGRWSRQPYGRNILTITGIATVEVTAEADGYKRSFGESEAVVKLHGFAHKPSVAEIIITGEADGIKTSEHLYFISEPKLEIQEYSATHVTVRSPTAEHTSNLPEIIDERRVDRLVEIDSGDAQTCEAIADELLDRWGRNQITVTGSIPLTVTLRFKEKLQIIIPGGGLDQELILQRKQHSLADFTTQVVCGDVSLSDDELLTRLLEQLT